MESYLCQQAIAKAQTIYYLDQKASTAYIANHFLKDRNKTFNLIRQGYSRRNLQQVSLNPQNILKTYADYWTGHINQSRVNNQPVVILHIRYSNDANSDQNLPDDFLPKFEAYIEQKGYRVWYIFADGRERNSFVGIQEHRISPFSQPLKKIKVIIKY